MEKKGQLSVFIAVGIVLAITIFLLLIFRVKSNHASYPYINQLESQVFNEMNQCFEKSALEAVQIVGLQGGYFNLPNNYLNTESSKTAYAYFEGRDLLIEKDRIKKEISDYAIAAVPLCTKFDEKDYSVNFIENPVVRAEINDDKVLLSLSYPMTVSKGENTFELKKTYKTEVLVSLGNIHNNAKKIIEKLKEDPNYIDFTFLSKLDYKIDVFPYDKNLFVYTISDKDSKINDEPYIFRFAVKLQEDFARQNLRDGI